MKLIFVYQQEIEKKTSKEKQHSQIYSPKKIKGKKFLAYSNQRHLRTFLKTWHDTTEPYNKLKSIYI